MMEYIDKMEFDESVVKKFAKSGDVDKFKSIIKDRFKEIFIVQ